MSHIFPICAQASIFPQHKNLWIDVSASCSQHFDFIFVTFKLCTFCVQRTKQVKAWRGKVWAVKGMRKQFPVQVVHGLHCLACCVRTCIVMMQDDSFRLMNPAFVFYVFFDPTSLAHICPPATDVGVAKVIMNNFACCSNG